MKIMTRTILVFKAFYHIKAEIFKVIYKLLFGNSLFLGKKTTFRTHFHLWIEGGKIVVGRNCFFNHDCSLSSRAKITIGEGCIFGENVKIYDHNHNFSNPSILIKEQGYKAEEIKVGNHVWCGNNVNILKGSCIGNHCVIGAGCVVSGHIPDNNILKVDSNNSYKLLRIKQV